VAADPARDAFFMADQRFGSADTGEWDFSG
jgi:hypothetical protein